MNMSAQAYQEWDAVMRHSGTTIDSMQMSMKTLANAADSDNEAFTRLGMNLEDVKKMSSEELFSATITALQGVENQTERTAIASDLLGRGATELGALLNTSAEETEQMKKRVHELGGVMSDEAVKNSAKFQDSLQDMKTAMSGLKKGLVADFLPSFTQVMDGLTKIFAGEEGGENLLEKGITNVMSALSRSAEKIKPIISRLGEAAFKAIQENVPRIVIRGTKLLTDITKEVISNLPEILSNAKDVLSEVGGEIGNMVLGFLPDFLSEDISHIFGSISDFVGNIDFGKLKDSLGGLGDSLEPLIEKLSGGVAWAFDNVVKPFGEWLMNDALPAGIDALAGAFSVINDALEILAPVGQAVWEEFLSPLFSAVGDLAVGSLDLLGKGLKSIGDTFKDFDTVGFIDDIDQGHFWDNWKLGMEDIGNSLELFGEDIDDFFAGPGQTWNQIWQNVGSAVFDVKKKICDALEAIAGAIDKVTTAVEKAPSFISGYFDYMFSGEGFEDMFGKLDFGAFATGGRVTHPTLSILGEREPETVVPDSKLGMLGGVTININVEGGISSDYDVERIANKLADLNIFQTRAIGGTGF